MELLLTVVACTDAKISLTGTEGIVVGKSRHLDAGLICLTTFAQR